ncbi:uncharacterized protein [Drosophila kikkawai]|uniref:Secreted protein n=1 Tax=Drosophila kikkawai TaxID=30033 RepID=A0ABM3C6F4_DROKI|nr:uncharacterized protein LOC121502422 [Drosophila kikkawai]
MAKKWTALLLLLQLLSHLETGQAIWFPWYFQRYGLEPHSSRHGGRNKITCPPGYEFRSSTTLVPEPKTDLCNDNPVLQQLARLYVVSPERIVLLLSQPSLTDSCAEISDVLDKIKSSMENCVLAPDNLYGRLADGLRYFRTEVCAGGDGSNWKRCTGLQNSHSCLRELRTDMIECEAPADWYERQNETKVCHIYNDVLDCYYTRAALLCGLDSAKQLRSFAADAMGRAMVHKCKVNKRLPRVDNAMPEASGSEAGSKAMFFNCFIFLCILINF